MTRDEVKNMLPILRAFAEGQNIWFPKNKNTWQKENNNIELDEILIKNYVIGDKYFSARKAHALGEPVEVLGNLGVWSITTNPKWLPALQYRPKKKEWYDNIPKDGVLCWVWDATKNDIQPRVITSYSDWVGIEFEASGFRWRHAEPIKPEECYQGK
jgi:hypothetical protein